MGLAFIQLNIVCCFTQTLYKLRLGKPTNWITYTANMEEKLNGKNLNIFPVKNLCHTLL